MMSKDEMLGVVATEAAEAVSLKPEKAMSSMYCSSDDIFRWLLKFVESNGTQKTSAAKLGISEQYLSDVLKKRRDISPNLSLKLGYNRVVVFEPLEPRP